MCIKCSHQYFIGDSSVIVLRRQQANGFYYKDPHDEKNFYGFKIKVEVLLFLIDKLKQ